MTVSRSTVWKWIGAAGCIVLAAVVLSAWWFRSHPNQDIDQLLAESATWIEQGEADRAHAVLDSILRRDSANATARLYRGELLRNQGDLTGAL
ncbi:MAG: hypothetical protein ACC628_17400, partial [Pirellulaceae bacterium]